jgi:hypothetical protein
MFRVPISEFFGKLEKVTTENTGAGSEMCFELEGFHRVPKDEEMLYGKLKTIEESAGISLDCARQAVAVWEHEY